MFGLGPIELIVILVILLLLFGATRLPKLARSIGQSANEMQKGFKEGAAPESKDNQNPNQNS